MEHLSRVARFALGKSRIVPHTQQWSTFRRGQTHLGVTGDSRCAVGYAGRSGVEVTRAGAIALRLGWRAEPHPGPSKSLCGAGDRAGRSHADRGRRTPASTGLDWAVQSEPLLVGPPGCEYTRVLKQRSAAPKNPWQRSACGIESSRGRPGHPESRVRLIERLQPYFQATVSAQRFRGRSAFICAAGAGSTHRPKGEARLTQRMRPAGMVDDGEST